MTEHDATDALDDEMGGELGYADVDWATLPGGSAESHDRVLDLALDELEELALDELDDLSKWAAAQAFADYDRGDVFQDLCLRIVRTARPHPAIAYDEICLELLNDYLLDENYDDAVFLLPDIERVLCDDPMARPRYGAIINLLRGREADGLAVFQELAEECEDDALALVTLAEDLIGCDRLDAAHNLLEKADEVAAMEGDQEALAAIAEVRAFLAEDAASRE